MRRSAPLPTLRDCCILVLARNLHTTSLGAFLAVALPERCLVALLFKVLELGRLNEHSAALFSAAACDNPHLGEALSALKLQPLPAMALGPASGWLGQRPHLF